MARPTSQADLFVAAEAGFGTLFAVIDSMTVEEQQSAFNFTQDATKKEAHWARDMCLRDVLVHVHEWHKLLLSWVEANRVGESRPFLPAPYTWKTYGQMNLELWRKHQSTSLEESKSLVRSTHGQVVAMIQQFTNEELFEKGQFSWTGTTTLGSYCVSATSSHYDWATKKLRAHLKVVRASN